MVQVDYEYPNKYYLLKYAYYAAGFVKLNNSRPVSFGELL